MANKVLTRVWEHSQQRGAARCLVAVLADVADETGIAYPGIPYLAGMINEAEDYTYKLLRKLIEAGEVLHKPGGGRGRKTLYAVVVGLTDAQRSKVNTVLQSRVYHEKPARNPALQNRVSVNPALQNSVLQSEKPCTILDSKQSSFDASEPSEPPIDENMIHGRSMDDSNSSARAILRDCGLYNGTIRQVLALGIDEPTLIASVRNLADAGWGAGAIANELRDNPPVKGHPYAKPEQRSVGLDAPDRLQRSASRARGTHNGTGGAEIRDPGWMERAIAEAEARARSEL